MMGNTDEVKEAAADVAASAAADVASSSAEVTASAAAEAASSASGDQSPPSSSNGAAAPEETVALNIVYKKQKLQLEAPLDGTVEALKKQLHPLIEVPPSMQKVMIKGLARDDRTLRQLGVTSGAKVMVVGSTLNDVLSVAKPDGKVKEEVKEEPEKERLCEMKQHKKVLDKGKPDDVMPARKNVHEPLPPTPLSGMLNRTGGKVRLTFKMENDQLWIGTKERTEKVSMSSVKAVVSETITGHEDYHIVGLQLGPTEASRYWLYWVPAQYVNAVKDTVLGKWQYF